MVDIQKAFDRQTSRGPLSAGSVHTFFEELENMTNGFQIARGIFQILSKDPYSTVVALVGEYFWNIPHSCN